MPKFSIKKNNGLIKDYNRRTENTTETIAKHNYYNSKLEIKTNDYFNDLDFEGNIDVNDLDYVLLVNKLKTIFINYFDYEINNPNMSGREKRNFIVKMEESLFEHGEVAIVKYGEKFYPVSNFEYDKADLDFYDVPKKIRVNLNSNLVDLDLFKEVEITDSKVEYIFSNEGDVKNFVIIYNNALRKPTLWNLQNRVIQLVKRIRELDYANKISKPHIFWRTDTNDESIRDAEIALDNDKRSIVRVADDFNDKILQITGTDVTGARQQQVIFYINFLLKLLGSDVDDLSNKAERKTELEIRKSETFTEVILDMYNERNYGFEDVRDLGLDAKIGENEQKKESNNQKQQLNGEVNKKLYQNNDEGDSDVK